MQRAAESQGAHLSAFKPIGRLTAVIDGNAELVHCDLVSGDFYQSMGVRPLAGRAILPADDRRNADGTVAVISEAFWARRFGRDRSILGQTIRINQVPVTIVGVNPPSFTGFTAGRQPDVFLPVTAQPALLPGRPGERRRDDRRSQLLVGAVDGTRAGGRRRGAGAARDERCDGRPGQAPARSHGGPVARTCG